MIIETATKTRVSSQTLSKKVKKISAFYVQNLCGVDENFFLYIGIIGFLLFCAKFYEYLNLHIKNIKYKDLNPFFGSK